MNDNERAAIRERLDAISPGQWRVVYDNSWNGLQVKHDRFSVVCDMSTTLEFGATALMFLGAPGGYEHSEENALFVAHAPDDIRALLKDNEELLSRAELSERALAKELRRAVDTDDLEMKQAKINGKWKWLNHKMTIQVHICGEDSFSPDVRDARKAMAVLFESESSK